MRPQDYSSVSCLSNCLPNLSWYPAHHRFVNTRDWQRAQLPQRCTQKI